MASDATSCRRSNFELCRQRCDAQVIIEFRPEQIELRTPVVTPIGSIETVWSVEVTVDDGSQRGVGRVKCQHEETAEQITAVGAEIVERVRLDEDRTDRDTWSWWRDAWVEIERRADGPELHALCGIDAAIWDLAAPAREGSSRLDPRIYWSGFWLDTTTDDARREAADCVALGFDAVKMRANARDLASTIARFDAIADELPAEMPIAIEFFGTGTVDYVTRLVGAIDVTRVLWLEDPVPPSEPQATAQLAALLTVPIGGGEHCLGVGELDGYVGPAGIAVPIIDLGCCGGPSALRSFLDASGARHATRSVSTSTRP